MGDFWKQCGLYTFLIGAVITAGTFILGTLLCGIGGVTAPIGIGFLLLAVGIPIFMVMPIGVCMICCGSYCYMDAIISKSKIDQVNRKLDKQKVKRDARLQKAKDKRDAKAEKRRKK